MKRTIVVLLGFAALAAPLASAGSPASLSPTQGITGQEDRGHHVAGPASTVAKSPVERIIAQEDARRNDPGLLGPGPVAPTVEIVESSGFHWGDAGIGAAVIVAAMLVLAGTTLVVRSRRLSQA